MNKIDWTKWSAIAEILGAIAVVTTLLYLSLQTKYQATQTEQNTAALLASVRQDMFTNDQAIFFNRMNMYTCTRDPISFEWSAPICGQIDARAFFRSRENNWLQYRDGVIDEATFESYNRPFIAALQNDEGFATTLWSRIRNELSDEFVEYVDQQLRR